MHCWHVPDTDVVLKCIHKLMDETKIVNNNLNESVFLKKNDKKNHTLKGVISNQEELFVTIDKYQDLVFLKFPFNDQLKSEIKTITGWWFHIGVKLWSIPYSNENMVLINQMATKFGYILRIKEWNNYLLVKKANKKPASRNNIPEKYLTQLKLENKSIRTIEVYTGFISQFIKDFVNKDIEHLSNEEIRSYILEHREKRNYSESYQNQMVSSIKSFYRIVYQKEFEQGILPRPKTGRYLPKVLPREDIQRMFDACRNEKHKTILILLYGFGMRVGEVLNLSIQEINFDRKQITILKGKGRKDRSLPIPNELIEVLKKYIKNYMPRKYFIVGQDGGIYSPASIQSLVHNLAYRAGIKRRVTPHMLRHCYATHMLEKGIDIRYIQSLLGHKSSKTTEIYTHIRMHKLNELGNPLDDIKL